VRLAGSFDQGDVDLATWWGPGGLIEARAALRELRAVLRG
jgi:hypothetical protein